MATTYSSWHRPADDNRDPQPPSYSLCEVKDLPATQPEYSSNPASTSTLPPSSDLSPPQPSLLHLWLSQLSSVLAQPAESTPPKQALQAFRRSHPRTNHITKPAGRKLLRDPSKSRNHSKSFSHLLSMMANRNTREPTEAFHMTTRARGRIASSSQAEVDSVRASTPQANPSRTSADSTPMSTIPVTRNRPTTRASRKAKADLPVLATTLPTESKTSSEHQSQPLRVDDTSTMPSSEVNAPRSPEVEDEIVVSTFNVQSMAGKKRSRSHSADGSTGRDRPFPKKRKPTPTKTPSFLVASNIPNAPILDKIYLKAYEETQQQSQPVDKQTSNGSESQRQSGPTKHQADAATPPEPEQNAGRGRGGFRGRGRGKGFRGGRGRGRGGGFGRGRPNKRGDESPEPPQRNRNLTPDQEDTVRKLKARQVELKRFFSIVGLQQTDILDQLSSRDLKNVLKKPNAHKAVPEYDALDTQLKTRLEETKEQIRKNYQLQLAHAEELKKKREDVIDMQYHQHLRSVKAEYLQGVQGDISLLHQAHTNAMDDAHTEAGSESGAMPHYHEAPDPDRRPRGLSSRSIVDDKAFHADLPGPEETAALDVIDDEILGPMRKEIEEKFKEKQTQTMGALVGEAEKHLAEIRGYLVPPPAKRAELSAFALSALADVADYVSEYHTAQPHRYMPPVPGDTFPRDALDLVGAGRRLAPAPTHLPPPPPPLPTIHSQPPVRNSGSPARQRRRRTKQTSPHSSSLRLQAPPVQPMTNGSHGPIPMPPPAPTPNIMPAPPPASGIGPAIAPAPLRPTQSLAPIQTTNFRHSSYSIPTQTPLHRPSPSSRSSAGSQFIIQTPQQAPGRQSAGNTPSWNVSTSSMRRPSVGSPGPGGRMGSFSIGPLSASSPTTSVGPGSLSGTGGLSFSPAVAHKGTLPNVQFINNTPASTKEKAERRAEKRRAEEERERIRLAENKQALAEGKKGNGERVILPKTG